MTHNRIVKEKRAALNRRQFLQAAGLTAVAATATGTGAAILAHKSAEPAAITLVSTPNTPLATPFATATNEEVAQLLAQLATTAAENERLRTALDAAERSLTTQSTAADSAAEPVLLELEAAHAQIGVLAGLLALYEQLDEVDVATIWDEGVTAVTTAFDNLLTETPLLNEGIAAGRQALLEMEAHIPLLQNGRLWVSDHLGRLRAAYDRVQNLLETAVTVVGPFLEMLNQWFQDILQWLPFGLGERTAEMMQALANLLGETPATIGGLDSQIAQPLDAWLAAPANEEIPLQTGLIQPLRQEVLDRAEAVVSKASQARAAYEVSLAEPVATAVANRQVLRTLIAQYREQHSLS
ncbi:MAG: twin-arginine translocation signal domain-containing protein [Ardenticatenaceae bacterium]|nr:twin-arginine translocation signal domain-containing protein [Ardenticatenaceae bacterium]